MLDLENTPMLLSLTSSDRAQNLLTTTAWLFLTHFLCSIVHVFSSKPRGEKKTKKTTNNTGQLKRKKGDGRGVGINYLVAHNWEGEARPA